MSTEVRRYVDDIDADSHDESDGEERDVPKFNEAIVYVGHLKDHWEDVDSGDEEVSFRTTYGILHPHPCARCTHHFLKKHPGGAQMELVCFHIPPTSSS